MNFIKIPSLTEKLNKKNGCEFFKTSCHNWEQPLIKNTQMMKMTRLEKFAKRPDCHLAVYQFS